MAQPNLSILAATRVTAEWTLGGWRVTRWAIFAVSRWRDFGAMPLTRRVSLERRRSESKSEKK